MTVLRYGHLRSAPVVVDVGVCTERDLHSLQPSVNSTRFGASSMACLSAPKMADTGVVVAVKDFATRSQFWSRTSRVIQNGDYQRFLALAGCGRHCATLSNGTDSLLQPTAQLAISLPVDRGMYFPYVWPTFFVLAISRSLLVIRSMILDLVVSDQDSIAESEKMQ